MSTSQPLYRFSRLIVATVSPYRQFALIGDSAGGNLVLGCAQRAREDRLLSPIALLLLYPVCSLIPRVSPSLALSFMDPMLHIKVLESCFDVYLENPFQCLDPLVSPAHIPGWIFFLSSFLVFLCVIEYVFIMSFLSLTIFTLLRCS